MLYTFDDQERKTIEFRQYWSNEARDWLNDKRTEWIYDSLGIKTESVEFTWTRTNNGYEWKEGYRKKTELVFDQAGNLVLTTESERNGSTVWTPVLTDERVYDPAGKLILETLTGRLARWPGPLPMRRQARIIRTFDEDGDISRDIWYYWDAVTKSYLFTSKDYYFYRSASTGRQVTGMDPVKVYPNPTSRILNLSGISQSAEVKIYSIQGMLLRTIHRVDVSVDISDLPSGAWLIQVDEPGHPPIRTILVKD